MDFFGPSSPAAPLINQATDAGLLTPDWAAIMAIVDMLTDFEPDECVTVYPRCP